MRFKVNQYLFLPIVALKLDMKIIDRAFMKYFVLCEVNIYSLKMPYAIVFCSLSIVSEFSIVIYHF